MVIQKKDTEIVSNTESINVTEEVFGTETELEPEIESELTETEEVPTELDDTEVESTENVEIESSETENSETKVEDTTSSESENNTQSNTNDISSGSQPNDNVESNNQQQSSNQESSEESSINPETCSHVEVVNFESGTTEEIVGDIVVQYDSGAYEREYTRVTTAEVSCMLFGIELEPYIHTETETGLCLDKITDYEAEFFRIGGLHKYTRWTQEREKLGLKPYNFFYINNLAEIGVELVKRNVGLIKEEDFNISIDIGTDDYMIVTSWGHDGTYLHDIYISDTKILVVLEFSC